MKKTTKMPAQESAINPAPAAMSTLPSPQSGAEDGGAGDLVERAAIFFNELDPQMLSQAAASLRLRAFFKGQVALDVSWGETCRFYDIASLTKIVATGTLVAVFVQDGRLDLEAQLTTYLPWFDQDASLQHGHIRVRDLMCHRAGLNWCYPFYDLLDNHADFAARWEGLKDLLSREPLQRPLTARYSDLDYLLLGMVLEAVGGQPLTVLWREFTEQAGIAGVFFHPNNQPLHDRTLYAPLEDLFVRQQVVRGEVHDGNCWFLGGVTGHAGLFADVDGLSQWALGVRASWRGEGGPPGYPLASTWQKFFARATPKGEEDWAWGWMMPTPGAASCGRFFGAEKSFGHTGFTGTSFWWDQEQDWMVLILANRLRPVHQNRNFPELRPRLHDAAHRAVFGRED